MKKNIILPLLFIALITSILFFTSCSASKTSTEAPGNPEFTNQNQYQTQSGAQSDATFGGVAMADKSSANQVSATETAAPNLQAGGFAISTSNKIIFNGNISLETMQFDKTISDLKYLILSNKGYIESSSINGNQYNLENLRNASLTIKIPQASFDSTLEKIGSLGNVISSSTSSQDITKQFIDTEARIKTLKIEEERMLSLLGKATKLEDIIMLEDRLSQIRLEIENYTGSLKEMQALTDYGTINVYIGEVKELTTNESGFGSSIALALQDSLKNILKVFEAGIVGIIYIIPYLIILLIIGILLNKFGLFNRFKVNKATKEIKSNSKNQNNNKEDDM